MWIASTCEFQCSVRNIEAPRYFRDFQRLENRAILVRPEIATAAAISLGQLATDGARLLPRPSMTVPTALKPIKLTDVPVAPGVDLAMLKGTNAEGLEVLAIFQPQSQADRRLLQALVAKAQEAKLAGSKGHLSTAEASHRFPDVAIHWLGGLELDDGRIAFRGIVDEAQTDLARWIRAGRIAVEPWQEHQAVALDALPADRSTHGTPAVAVTDDGPITVDHGPDGTGTGRTAGASSGPGAESENGTGADSENGTGADGATGEMFINGVSMAGLRRRSTPITPASDMGEMLTPHGYETDDTTVPAATSTNATMAGLPRRARQI